VIKLIIFLRNAIFITSFAYFVLIAFIGVMSFVSWDINLIIDMFQSLTWYGFRVTFLFSALISVVVTYVKYEGW